ncbi:KpsF/GutQ family sugar-phosphate isomerase [Salinisphaera orenii]|uniref:KpsF/GutQ family sugar-phosphate isomerase n=1 Tax=Salinisphaera orenii TaxID=856731 RepID=UPI000DBE5B14
MDKDTRIKAGQRVIAIEAEAATALADRVDSAFDDAVTTVLNTAGRVIVTGVGKSGHIGGKIAATLASTGTPAFFVHAGEASHGDLGMVTRNDVVLALSYSGETGELLQLLPLLKRLGTPLICMTGRPESTLATRADVHLDVSVTIEACPLDLAPSASTTAALVMGDALAITLLEARDFGVADFARSHPGGQLGRRLLMTVDDVMHQGDELPLIGLDATIGDALLEMTAKGLGMTGVADADGHLAGVFTDGDLRRTLDLGTDPRSTPIAEAMTQSPKTISAGALATEAIQMLETHRIGGGGLFVVDTDNHAVGALNTQDLLRAGIL